MTKVMSPPYGVAISFQDQLQEDATKAAMKAVGKILWGMIEQNPLRPISLLSEDELQWLAIAAISGWCLKRAEQAKGLAKTANQLEEFIKEIPNGGSDENGTGSDATLQAST